MQKTFPGITITENLLSQIRNHYWHLRNIRSFQQAKRRKLYRDIAKIKAVLIADGFNPEHLRLWCRQYTRCQPDAAKARLSRYLQKSEDFYKSS
jgi:hypothetical protein